MKIGVDVETQSAPSRWPSFVATGLSVASQGILRLGISVLIGRLGGAALLGETASIMATAQIAALLGSSALGSAAAKYIALTRLPESSYSPARSARVIQYCNLLAILIVTPLAVGVWLFYFQRTGLILAIVAALVVGLSLYPVHRGIQLGTELYWRATFVDLITATGALAAIAIIGAVTQPGPIMLMPLAITYVVYALSSLPALPGTNDDRPAVPTKSVATFALLTTIGTLGSSGLAQASVLTARISGSETEAGVYAAAVAITAPLSMVASAISMAVFPRLVAILGSKQADGSFELAIPVISNVLALSCLIWPTFVIIAPIISSLLWGQSYPGIEETTRLLVLGSGIAMAGTVAVSVMTAISNRGAAISALLSWLGVIAAVTVWSTLGSGSAEAVSFGYLASTLVIGVIPLLLIARRVSWGWLAPCLKYFFMLFGALLIDLASGEQPIYRCVVATIVLVISVAIFWSDLRTLTRDGQL